MTTSSIRTPAIVQVAGYGGGSLISDDSLAGGYDVGQFPAVLPGAPVQAAFGQAGQAVQGAIGGAGDWLLGGIERLALIGAGVAVVAIVGVVAVKAVMKR